MLSFQKISLVYLMEIIILFIIINYVIFIQYINNLKKVFITLSFISKDVCNFIQILFILKIKIHSMY